MICFSDTGSGGSDMVLEISLGGGDALVGAAPFWAEEGATPSELCAHERLCSLAVLDISDKEPARRAFLSRFRDLSSVKVDSRPNDLILLLLRSRVRIFRKSALYNWSGTLSKSCPLKESTPNFLAFSSFLKAQR